MFVALTVITAMAQPSAPDTLWTRTFGGTGDDWGFYVEQTSDGGFIITGGTDSFGAGMADIYLIKTESNGDTMWTKTFGGEFMDWGMCVLQTEDGGYIIAGSTTSFGMGAWDAFLIKTGANGNETWNRTIGGLQLDAGNCLAQTPDGGFIIAGTTYSFGAGESDMYLVKTDFEGNVIWSQTFGGNEMDGAGGVQRTIDGGCIAAGWTGPSGNYDVLLVKTDSSGVEEWQQTFGGPEWDDAWAVRQTADGGYILAGSTRSYGAGSNDIYVIKTDELGNEIWNRAIGGEGEDSGSDVKLTTDGGFIVTGWTEAPGSSTDVYILKIDEDGDEIWSKTIGGYDYDLGYCTVITSGEEFVIAGCTNSYGVGESDIYLVRLEAEGAAVEENLSEAPAVSSLSPLYPNPFNDSSTMTFSVAKAGEVRLAVYDVQGREVQSLVNGHLSLGKHRVVWNAEGAASGTYFVRLMVDGGQLTVPGSRQTAVRKAVLVK